METQFANPQDIKDSLKQILSFIGDNPDREGLVDTPDRIIKSWSELFSGYNQNPSDILRTFSEGTCKEMVILSNIDFHSTCEHHFLPFFGKIHIGYLPDKKVIGVSKLARLVEIFSRRLQIQEKMTTQIAEAIMNSLHPLGVMVVCEATHLCIQSRGVKKQSIMITNAIRGDFEKAEVRNEFLSMVRN